MRLSRLIPVDFRALLSDHVADVSDAIAEADEAAAAPPRPYGATTETQDDRARRERNVAVAVAFMKSKWVGEERLPFDGPIQAMRALDAVRLDGPSIRSCWRVGEDQCDSQAVAAEGDSGQRDVERVAFVARAWDKIMANGWILSTYPTVVWLTPEQARCVVAWAVLGLPTSVTPVQPNGGQRTEEAHRRPSKEVLASRSKWGSEPDDIAAYTLVQWGIRVPPGHVVSMRMRGVADLYVTLYESGQVPESQQWEEASMSENRAWDLDGWDEISDMVGRKISACRAAASRDVDPMPVHKLMGRVVARRCEIREWMERAPALKASS